jgi:hypothetical protein
MSKSAMRATDLCRARSRHRDPCGTPNPSRYRTPTAARSHSWRAVRRDADGRFAIPASDNTILRQLKRWAAGRARAAVRVVGIDDWSWRKGQTYGTIIVELEQHDVVELIAERLMETVADWFA